MAKRKEISDAALLAAFEEIDKLNPDGAILANNALSTVDEYYDTGSLALNAICSGSMFGGIPKGRVVGFTGVSQAGKSFFINRTIASAQRKGKFGVIFDSEIAVDKAGAEAMGVDTTRCKHYPIASIEDCRNQLVAFLDKVNANPDLKGKFIVAVDSFGNLGSAKEDKDATEGKSASDMGQRAKALKSLLRQVTYRAARAGITILFSNHVYGDPTAMYPTLVKRQSGGEGPIYMASLLVQLDAKKEEKDEKNEMDVGLTEMKKYSGTIIRAITTKNRFIPPFLEANMYLNFVNGPEKYYGLQDMAVAHGVLDFNGKTYTVKSSGEKLGYLKDFRHDAKVWEQHILPDLEKSIQEKYRYGAGNQPVAPEAEPQPETVDEATE